MSVLITVVGVWLGYAYVRLVSRRLGLTDRRRWLLLAPVWAAYVVVLRTADTADPGPRAVQAFALAALLGTAVDVVRGLWSRRGARRGRRSDTGVSP
ncbi:hypothetical protein GCM10023328_08780 [Modestobacter marinus]|uniref:Uncharacterized protein n=1 Tax=Modestobacter marinus TaxID=477641 RepID=A0A846LKU7_9ACTN|nr:hypothetical protein [Modestobacter marinus]NIH66702.1 hypothetical protein [Modestobacter marinus]GGL48414.1 hypothetical protein GCM10011589_01180 [Modestobacter marinus]